MKGKQLCVAISGLHLGENAQPGPGVIRSLREAHGSSLHVVGLAYDALDSSLYAPGLLDDAYLLPYPSVSPEAYLERLLEIDAHCGLDVLIPCLDSELPVLQCLSPELEAHRIRCVLPNRESLSFRSKERLAELAARVGVAVPATRRVEGFDSVARAVSELGLPCVIKGPFCDAEIAHSLEQALHAFERLSRQWGLPLLAQRFVAGDEFNVAALGDGLGGMPLAVAMRKTILTRLGKAWGAMTVDDPRALEVAQKVVSGLAWRGGCEVELLKARDGAIYLIEVNPRFPAWIYLCTASGANLPKALVDMALGQPLTDRASYRAGVFYVRHAAEAIGDVSDLENMVSRGRRESARPASVAELQR